MVVEPKDLKFKGKKASNKREFFRLNERIKIKVRQLAKRDGNQPIDDLTVKGAEKVYEFHSQDISAGGMAFFSEVFFKENSYVEITLIFKETDPPFEPVKVFAVVLRAEQVENSRFYNISVMFVDIDQRDRCDIEHYIFFRQREMISEKRIGFL